MKNKWRVVIFSYVDDEVVKALDWENSPTRAEAIDRGVNINLNHKKYYTEIEVAI